MLGRTLAGDVPGFIVGLDDQGTSHLWYLGTDPLEKVRYAFVLQSVSPGGHVPVAIATDPIPLGIASGSTRRPVTSTMRRWTRN